MKRVISRLAIICSVICFGSPINLSAQAGMDFDGTNDYVSIPNASSLIAGSSAISMSFWVYPENTSAGFPNFDGFAGLRNNSNADFYLLQLSSTNVEARFRNSAGVNFDIVFSGLNLNQWNHFVFTYDGSAITLFHDGINVGTAPASGSISSTTTPLELGRTFFSNPSFYLNGKLDNVALWTSALNPNEVSNLYNNTCSHDLSDPSLVLCYEFNEGVIGGNNLGLGSLYDWKQNINGVFNGLALNGAVSNYVLGIVPSATTSTIDTSTCSSYTSPSGNYTYTMPGTYMDTILNVYGCDSLITINLTNLEYQTTIAVSECTSYTTPSGGATYTNSGVYYDTLPSVGGCDSVIIISLTIATFQTNVTETACESYTVPSGNATYTTSGVYNDTLLTVGGCDSVLVIDLLINGSSSSISETACDSYTVPSGNATYTTSGIYMDTIPNGAGCDSIMTITLTINSVDTGVSLLGETLTSSDATGTYQWINCATNSFVIGETNQSYTPLITGDYAVIVTSGNCSDTSACTTVTISGIGLEEELLSKVSVYPNPVDDYLMIEFAAAMEDLSVQVRNLAGQELISEALDNASSIELSFEDFDSGVYFVTVRIGNNEKLYKVMKM